MLQRSIHFAKGMAALSAAVVAHASMADAAPARAKRTPRVEVAALAAPARPQPARSVAAVPQVPPVAVVSLGAQTITLYSGTNVIGQAPISSGMDGYRTPTGVFSIIQKNKYHESNIYSGAPMPFMQRLTWSGIALHAGKLPGYRASHGCVRLPYDFAERLFSMTRMGARVIVTPEVVAPQTVLHAALPTPIMTLETMTASVPALPRVATGSGLSAGALTLAFAGANDGDAPVQRLLNPMQVAEVDKRRLAVAHANAVQRAKTALDAAGSAALMSDAVRAERVDLERQIVAYAEMLARARNGVVLATSDEDRVQADASLHAAEEAVEDVKAALAIARRAETAAYDASFKSARAARELEDAADAAETAARVASRGMDPITIFVSRKEGKVLVRQGWQTIMEGDVTFREPQTPLGTHVFTAISAEDSALRWTSVSIADGPVARLSATSALDRIAIDPALSAEIGKRLWTGATLIVSDQGISNETGRGTDFVVLTK